MVPGERGEKADSNDGSIKGVQSRTGKRQKIDKVGAGSLFLKSAVP